MFARPMVRRETSALPRIDPLRDLSSSLCDSSSLLFFLFLVMFLLSLRRQCVSATLLQLMYFSCCCSSLSHLYSNTLSINFLNRSQSCPSPRRSSSLLGIFGGSTVRSRGNIGQGNPVRCSLLFALGSSSFHLFSNTLSIYTSHLFWLSCNPIFLRADLLLFWILRRAGVVSPWDPLPGYSVRAPLIFW